MLLWILQRFHTEGAKIEEIDGFEMVKRMAANVETMMQHKIDAIKVQNLNLFQDMNLLTFLNWKRFKK